MIRIADADFDDPQLEALLTLHTSRARAETGRGSAHALDMADLRTPDIRLWSAYDSIALVGVAALKRLAPDHGEVKSMYTVERARRSGVGSLLLRHLIEHARAVGTVRISLETGSWPYFEPARTFYRAHGFDECGPFGDYRPDPNSVFMTRAP